MTQRLKRQVRIWKLVARILTFVLAIYPLYSQAITLHKFLSTQDIIIDGRNAWAKTTIIWPTILLLSTSGATILVSLLVLASYLFSVKHANKTDKTIGTAGFVVEMGAHISVWIATAAAYRLGNTGNDLWGWTCSDKADQIQDQFEAVIDFDNLCNVQVRLSLTVEAVYMLTIRTVVVCLGLECRTSCSPHREWSGILLGLETNEAQGKNGERHNDQHNALLILLCRASLSNRIGKTD